MQSPRHPEILRGGDHTHAFDVVVVGGGPAGSSCAIALANCGARVALIDGQPRGRDKCCGHCLSGGAWKTLEELGLRSIVESVATGPTRMVAWRSGAQEFEMKLSVIGAITPRMELDAKLLDEAERVGVRVIQPATATWLDHGAVMVRSPGMEQLLRTGLLVAADGLGSGIARARGWNPARPGRKFGFAGSWHAPGALSRWPSDRIEMRVLRGGYLGVVAEPNGRIHIAGLGNRASQASRPADLLAEAASSWPLLAQALMEGRPDKWIAAGPLPWRPTCIADESAALVGDAAGYAEPFSGEGMRWAFESSNGLAQAWRANGGWNPKAARMYADWHRDRISRRQTSALRTAWLLEEPARASVACRTARRFPRVASWLAGSMTR